MNTLNMQSIPQPRLDLDVCYYSSFELDMLPYTSSTCKYWNLILAKGGVLPGIEDNRSLAFNNGFFILPSWVKVGNLISLKRFRGCAVSIPSELVNRMDINISLFQTQVIGPCIFLPGRDVQLIETYMSLIKDTLTNSSSHYSSVELFCLCKALLLNCCRYCLVDKLPKTRITRNPKVAKFIDLVWKDCAVYRDLSHYSEIICVSPKYLSSLIAKETGRKAIDWIYEATIATAKKLIDNGDLSIEKVAAALHFKSSSDFCKYFKRCTGLTALQYRNQA